MQSRRSGDRQNENLSRHVDWPQQLYIDLRASGNYVGRTDHDAKRIGASDAIRNHHWTTDVGKQNGWPKKNN